jgi:hypothetical protein
MKRRLGYKGYVIVARSCELQDGGLSAEVSIQEHDADGFTETEFYLPDTFPRRSPRLRQEFRLDDRRLMWGLSGDQQS